MNWSQLCGGEVFFAFFDFCMNERYRCGGGFRTHVNHWSQFFFLLQPGILALSRSHTLVRLSHFVNFYCVSSRSHALALSSVSRILIIFTAA